MTKMRTRPTLTLGLIALLGFAAAPASAGTATYSMTREVTRAYQPDLHLEITVRGRFIVKIDGDMPWNCYDDKGERGGFSFFRYSGLRIHLDREGRFDWNHLEEYDGTRDPGDLRERTYFKGRVGDDRLWGHIGVDHIDSTGLGERCWTGKSEANPLVKFVARRRRQP